MFYELFTTEFVKKSYAIISNKSNYYHHFKIPKKNGKDRLIIAPNDELKSMQKKLLDIFSKLYAVHDIAHGFTYERSPYTNASHHVGAKIVVNLDLKDFFPSIKIYRIENLLNTLLTKNLKMFGETRLKRDKVIKLLAELVTLNGALPQGAPTSPLFSNLCAYDMDVQLKDLEPQFACTITRYADDISASSDYNVMLPKIIPMIRRIVHTNGFRINETKTHVGRSSKRMMVTGIVVNERANISKKTRRNLRAELHNLKGTSISLKKYQQYRGKIAWVNYLNTTHGCNLLSQLDNIVVEGGGVSNVL